MQLLVENIFAKLHIGSYAYDIVLFLFEFATQLFNSIFVINVCCRPSWQSSVENLLNHQEEVVVAVVKEVSLIFPLTIDRSPH